MSYLHWKPQLFQYLALTLLMLISVLIMPPASPAKAACAAVPTTFGTATTTVSVPSAGTYRVWSRIMAPNNTANSYILEVDDTTCGVVVGDSAITANTWTWVDYLDNNASSKINLTLTQGNHSFRLIGREDGVKLDRVILTTDMSCVPTDKGDNCASPVSPVKPGNLNNDQAVDIFDLSILLAHFGRAGTAAQGDIDNNGAVGISDLSILLSNWGAL